MGDLVQELFAGIPKHNVEMLYAMNTLKSGPVAKPEYLFLVRIPNDRPAHPTHIFGT